MLWKTWRLWIRTTWYNYENDQQVALYRLIYYSKSALHVSGDVFAHHQEHLTIFTVSGSVHPSCCRLVSWMSWNAWIRASWYNYENNQQDALYRLIYYSKSDLHVSCDVFAHHQEHLAVFTASGRVHPSCSRPVSWISWNCVSPHPCRILQTRQSSTQSDKYQVLHRYSYFFWWWTHCCPKHVEKSCAPSWLYLQDYVEFSSCGSMVPGIRAPEIMFWWQLSWWGRDNDLFVDGWESGNSHTCGVI